MLDGVMLLWFILVGISLLFVALDIPHTPESKILKWGFILVTAYTGPLGAFLYVLGCREPLPGLHERYVAVKWRQVLGSTMHCVAGDGVGILVGAVIASSLNFSQGEHIVVEYFLGFGFGWAIFQALFMRDMAGGSYTRSLSTTFFPELLSMNCLMAGMVPVMTIAMMHVPASHHPNRPEFWFIMSMALLVGFITAYPMNWWLVSKKLKHGMMTVRPDNSMKHGHHEESQNGSAGAHSEMHAANGVSNKMLATMTLFSFLLFALGLGSAYYFNAI